MHAPLGVGDRNVPEETMYDAETYHRCQWFMTPWANEVHGWLLPKSEEASGILCWLTADQLGRWKS